MEHFDAPWDAGLKGITAGVLVVCALAIAGTVAVGVRIASPAAGTAGGIALSVVIGVLPFPAMLILFASIRDVAMLDPKVFLRRVGGVGGLVAAVRARLGRPA